MTHQIVFLYHSVAAVAAAVVCFPFARYIVFIFRCVVLHLQRKNISSRTLSLKLKIMLDMFCVCVRPPFVGFADAIVSEEPNARLTVPKRDYISPSQHRSHYTKCCRHDTHRGWCVATRHTNYHHTDGNNRRILNHLNCTCSQFVRNKVTSLRRWLQPAAAAMQINAGWKMAAQNDALPCIFFVRQ